jgi:hypothetical protein
MGGSSIFQGYMLKFDGESVVPLTAIKFKCTGFLCCALLTGGVCKEEERKMIRKKCAQASNWLSLNHLYD